MKRKIYTIGHRRRTNPYLKACAVVAITGVLLSPQIVNLVGVEKQTAQAEVLTPEHGVRMKELLGKDSLFEFDQNRYLGIEVQIVEGPHAGETAIARYSRIEKLISSKFDGSEELKKGSRINVEYTQGRLTGGLRIRSIDNKPR